jgi:hypothetical protein
MHISEGVWYTYSGDGEKNPLPDNTRFRELKLMTSNGSPTNKISRWVSAENVSQSVKVNRVAGKKGRGTRSSGDAEIRLTAKPRTIIGNTEKGC